MHLPPISHRSMGLYYIDGSFSFVSQSLSSVVEIALERGGRIEINGAMEIGGRFVVEIVVEICGFVSRFLEFVG